MDDKNEEKYHQDSRRGFFAKVARLGAAAVAGGPVAGTLAEMADTARPSEKVTQAYDVATSLYEYDVSPDNNIKTANGIIKSLPDMLSSGSVATFSFGQRHERPKVIIGFIGDEEPRSGQRFQRTSTKSNREYWVQFSGYDNNPLEDVLEGMGIKKSANIENQSTDAKLASYRLSGENLSTALGQLNQEQQRVVFPTESFGSDIFLQLTMDTQHSNVSGDLKAFCDARLLTILNEDSKLRHDTEITKYKASTLTTHTEIQLEGLECKYKAKTTVGLTPWAEINLSVDSNNRNVYAFSYKLYHDQRYDNSVRNADLRENKQPQQDEQVPDTEISFARDVTINALAANILAGRTKFSPAMHTV